MTQRIELNIAEKSYLSRKRLPMEKIQLAYKSQLTPFNFTSTAHSNPTNPIF